MPKINFVIAITGTLMMVYIMLVTGKNLDTPATPNGILNLEFAYNQSKVDTIITAWQPTPTIHRIQEAKINTYWDFLFLFFYGFLFYCVTLFLQKKFAATPLAGYGNTMLQLSLIAPLLDVVENIFMLAILNGSYANWYMPIMVTASTLKWLLVILIIAYSVWGLCNGRFKPLIK
jgi:hypothetical protein